MTALNGTNKEKPERNKSLDHALYLLLGIYAMAVTALVGLGLDTNEEYQRIRIAESLMKRASVINRADQQEVPQTLDQKLSGLPGKKELRAYSKEKREESQYTSVSLIQVGTVVQVTNFCDTDYYLGTYLGERNSVFPPGSIGTVKNVLLEEDRVFVQFPGSTIKGDWGHAWRTLTDYWAHGKYVAEFTYKELRAVTNSENEAKKSVLEQQNK